MTRAAFARGALAHFALVVAGCGAPPDPANPEPVPVDSALVRVLTDVALAEARASIDPARPAGRAADSLRAVALGVHGLTDADLRERQADLARDPLVARATYDALDRALTDERNRR